MDEIIKLSWYWLAIIGVLGGILSGALGVGAGILFVPALVIFLSFSQKAAQGTCLAVMVPMAMMGALGYYRNPDIKLNLHVILLMIPFAVVGAAIGSHIAASIPGPVLKKIFAVFVIIAGIKMLIPK